MSQKGRLACLFLMLAASGVATADTRIVQLSHQDEYTVMGQKQPAQDRHRTLWIGSDRFRMDEEDSSILVRLDANTMYLIDHANKSYASVELPIDLREYLPEGVGEQMLELMRFDVEVAASDETTMIGEWEARRYDLTMTSALATVKTSMWSTTDVEIDREAYYRMFEQIVALQPGMDAMVDKLRTIGGLVVQQKSITTMKMMGDAELTTRETTLSVDQSDAPAGTYDPPADYSEKPFNLMESMQQQ